MVRRRLIRTLTLLNFLEGDHFLTYSEALGRVSLYATHSLVNSASVEISRVVSLFAIASGQNGKYITVIGITPKATMIFLNVSIHRNPGSTTAPGEVTVVSETTLPLEMKPTMIVPVDPMGWSGQYAKQMLGAHDDLVSVGDGGELAFWRIDSSSASNNLKLTGRVKTQRQNIAMAACSSAKKTVLGTLRSTYR